MSKILRSKDIIKISASLFGIVTSVPVNELCLYLYRLLSVSLHIL